MNFESDPVSIEDRLDRLEWNVLTISRAVETLVSIVGNPDSVSRFLDEARKAACNESPQGGGTSTKNHPKTRIRSLDSKEIRLYLDYVCNLRDGLLTRAEAYDRRIVAAILREEQAWEDQEKTRVHSPQGRDTGKQDNDLSPDHLQESTDSQPDRSAQEPDVSICATCEASDTNPCTCIPL